MSDQDCQDFACSLQSCLNKNLYTPEKCDKHVKALYKCCKDMYRKDKNAESTACPIESKVDNKLKVLNASN